MSIDTGRSEEAEDTTKFKYLIILRVNKTMYNEQIITYIGNRNFLPYQVIQPGEEIEDATCI